MSSITVRRVAWQDTAAAALREAMMLELRDRYADLIASGELTWGDGMESVAYTGLAESDGSAVGHVALRWLGPDLEIKRMYVVPRARGTGVAQAILAAVEDTAREMGAPRLVLQTGNRQQDAVRLYERSGYVRVPIFPPYQNIDVSLCFAKALVITNGPVITSRACGATTRPRC